MSTIARRGLVSAVALALFLIPGTALGATKPIEQFHDHFTDRFSTDLCGIQVDAVIVVTDNFFVYEGDAFKDASSVRIRYTNPDTGKTVLVSSAGTVSGTASVDEAAGTITFVNTYTGLPEKIQTAHGTVLTRDAGVITLTDTFDLETNDFVSREVSVSGPHPEADADFELFCETLVSALA